jgi:hypothetical protein
MSAPNEIIDDVRIAFTYAGSNLPALYHVASLWQDKLQLDAHADVKPICIWASTPELARVGAASLSWYCWHSLDVPPQLDRYLATRRGGEFWSPWGLKSGPNWQFFRLLDQAAQEHESHWLLLLELDTFPLTNPLQALHQATRLNRDAWVIGGNPHPRAARKLPEYFSSHINGAALYRIGSRGFRTFRKSTWMPSLFDAVVHWENMAFDVLTSRELWPWLSPGLQFNWASHADRFVATSGIVNLSNCAVDELDPLELRSIITNARASAPEFAAPWLLHIKTKDILRVRSLIDRLVREA